MSKLIDLTGKRFGKLIVLSRSENKSTRVRWNCKCDCGNLCIVAGKSLKAGQESCGCFRGRYNFVDLVGKRFGRLIVVEQLPVNSLRQVEWLCKCDCGNKAIGTTSALKAGDKTSCGCAYTHDLTNRRFGMLTVCSRAANKRDKVTWNCQCECGQFTKASTSDLLLGKRVSCGCVQITHHGSKTRLYRIWSGMKDRCLNPNSHYHKWYGGRGITVCDEWANDFGAFRSWASAHGYSEGLSIDRIDNDGNYEPKNCQWLTISENVSKAQKGRHHALQTQVRPGRLPHPDPGA